MGNFTSGRFRFQVEASDWSSDLARGFHQEFEDDAFDLRLTGTGKIPDLCGAPIASWLLARLAYLTGDRLGLAGVEYNDGGGYEIEFLVYVVPTEEASKKAAFVQPLLFNMDELGVYVESEKPIASFQFDAHMEGASVIGQRTADCSSEELLQALAGALLAAPTELMPRELAVIDPEWKLDPEMYRPEPVKGSRNWYGWDGSIFLGKNNIR